MPDNPFIESLTSIAQNVQAPPKHFHSATLKSLEDACAITTETIMEKLVKHILSAIVGGFYLLFSGILFVGLIITDAIID
ncbi:MAG: hypothetical protein RJP95_00555 [Pirellulales bacterium]